MLVGSSTTSKARARNRNRARDEGRLTYIGVCTVLGLAIAALDALAKAEPQLRQMPGHDGPRERALVEEGLLTAAFH